MVVRFELDPADYRVRAGDDGRLERYYTTHCETCGVEQRHLRVFSFPLTFHDFYQYCFFDGHRGVKHICKVCEHKYQQYQA